MAYQVVSLVAVVVIAAINAWYNNDISKVALLCGGVFDALSDGKITEEEIENKRNDWAFEFDSQKCRCLAFIHLLQANLELDQVLLFEV